MNYNVRIERRAVRELDRVNQATRPRLVEAIDGLASDPFAGPALRGPWRRFRRVRVGDYRIVYRVDSKSTQVDVVHVRHRKDAYGRPP